MRAMLSLQPLTIFMRPYSRWRCSYEREQLPTANRRHDERRHSDVIAKARRKAARAAVDQCRALDEARS